MRKSFTGRGAGRIIRPVALASLLFVVLAPSGMRADVHAGSPCQSVPDAWAPSLDQVRNYLEEKSNEDTRASQRQLTQTSQLLADLSDAQLFIAYVQLMRTLDVKGQRRLFEEQKSWLGTRAEAARASVTSKGGTLGPLEYSSAFGELTKARLAELQKRLPRQGSATRDRKEREKR
jgi:uncharacterized protein YecT (DUF1311 family)